MLLAGLACDVRVLRSLLSAARDMNSRQAVSQSVAAFSDLPVLLLHLVDAAMQNER